MKILTQNRTDKLISPNLTLRNGNLENVDPSSSINKKIKKYTQQQQDGIYETIVI